MHVTSPYLMLSMAMFRLFAKFDVMHAYEPYAS